MYRKEPTSTRARIFLVLAWSLWIPIWMVTIDVTAECITRLELVPEEEGFGMVVGLAGLFLVTPIGLVSSIVVGVHWREPWVPLVSALATGLGAILLPWAMVELGDELGWLLFLPVMLVPLVVFRRQHERPGVGGWRRARKHARPLPGARRATVGGKRSDTPTGPPRP